MSKREDLPVRQRKTLLVSVYYTGDKPITWYDDMDNPDWLFLNDAIEIVMQEHNVNTTICDVAIDDTRDWLFRTYAWWPRYIFRLLRKKGY
jgi:hypothetical protein